MALDPRFRSAAVLLLAVTTPTTIASTTTTSLVELTPVSSAGTIPWGWVGLGTGLPLLLFGLWLLIGRDCERLRREWETLQRQYDQIREAFDKARANLEEARAVRAEIEVQESVEEWRRQLEEAAVRADRARRAYEECIGKVVAGLTQPAADVAAADSTATGGSPMVAATSEPSPCPDGTREARPLESPRTFRLYVDFAVIVEVEEGSERNVQTREDLAIGLGQLGLDLGAIGSLLGARGAGSSVASGVSGLGVGSYVKASLGIARGSVEGLLAVRGNLGTTSFPIPVPTSPEEVLVGVLQVTALLRSLVAGKVTEWMKMNQIYRVRSALFYQEVSVQPIQIWECKGGNWVCVEKVLQYEVSELERQPGASQSFRIEGDVSRHQFEAYVDGATARAQQSIEASARALVEFEQSNSPGPC